MSKPLRRYASLPPHLGVFHHALYILFCDCHVVQLFCMLDSDLNNFLFVMASYHKATLWITFNFLELLWHRHHLLKLVTSVSDKGKGPQYILYTLFIKDCLKEFSQLLP